MEKQKIDTEIIVKQYLENKLDVYFRKISTRNEWDRYILTYKTSPVKDIIEVCINTGNIKVNGKDKLDIDNNV